jgi:hypothetical protein
MTDAGVGRQVVAILSGVARVILADLDSEDVTTNTFKIERLKRLRNVWKGVLDLTDVEPVAQPPDRAVE